MASIIVTEIFLKEAKYSNLSLQLLNLSNIHLNNN